MPPRRGTKSPHRGQLKAAAGRDPVAFYREIIRRLRDHAREHGEPVRGGEFYHVEMSATKLFRDDFALAGSHVRAIQVLQKVRIMVLVSHNLQGVAARKRGARSTVWAVNMTREPEGREFMDATEAVYRDQEEQRKRRRKDERLTPGMPDQTTGTAAPARHNHSTVETHEHGQLTGPHRHESIREGDVEVVRPVWIEWRHHTHKERQEVAVGPNGTGTATREVVEDLAGGRAAVLERRHKAPAKRPGETPSEGRHRRLMELVVTLEDRVAELESHNRHVVLQLEAERQKVAELETLLESATDPTEQEAEEFLAERGK